jgi:predicted flap endonuclease-1-like 5' DNA nuclease
LVGALLGWLLNYWLSKRCCKKPKETTSPPSAKMADVPATSVTPNEKTPAPAKQPLKKASPKTAEAKPKTVAATKSVIDLATAKAAGITIKNADYLIVIEGIGPKINELFQDNGLKSFADGGKPADKCKSEISTFNSCYT